MTALVTEKFQSTPVVNTVAGVLSGSTDPEGDLVCTKGTWTGSQPRSMTYQFYRDGVAVGDESSSNVYTKSEDDDGTTITCKPICTNSNGRVVGTESNGIAVVAP